MHTILVGSVSIAIFAGLAYALVYYLTRRESRFERDHRLMIDAMRPASPPRSMGPATADVPRLYTDGEMDASGLTVIDPIADYRARATPEELASLDVTAVYPSAHPLARRSLAPSRASRSPSRAVDADRPAHGYDSSGSGFNDARQARPARVDGSSRQDTTIPGHTEPGEPGEP